MKFLPPINKKSLQVSFSIYFVAFVGLITCVAPASALAQDQVNPADTVLATGAEITPDTADVQTMDTSDTTIEPINPEVGEEVIELIEKVEDTAATPEDAGPYTRAELRKGERLFKGLVGFASGTHDCSSCHYPLRTDTLNWNPSAYELASLSLLDETYSIRQKLANPIGLRMVADHEGMSLTEQEERQLEAYLAKVAEGGPGQLKAIPVNAVIFWGIGLLMALALVDLLLTRKIKARALHVLVIIAGLVVHMQYAVAEGQALGRTQGYEPDQPIKFSHMIHAGENEIDCNYCHTAANFSQSAGIPSNNTCLNCHGVIREGTNSGRFEINKIHQAAANDEAVSWIRIHKLPDHSFFSHAQHVNAGQIECQECHGPVEERHLVRQEEELSMGWCLSCHRDTGVNFLDNPYYHIFERLHDDIRAGRIDAVTAAQVGGEDCMKCHY